MVTSTTYLSSFVNAKIQTNTDNFVLKQFQRTYPGNYALNFVDALSNINDVNTKNYTNFYLTNNYKISDIFEQPKTKNKLVNIFGTLISGDKFLKFSDIDPMPYAIANRFDEHYNYGVPVFSNIEDESTNFTISIFNDNRCNIFYTKNYKKYYLCADIDNNLVFVKQNLLTFNKNSTNAQDFQFIFSEAKNEIFLYKNTQSGNYSVVNYNNSLILNDIISNDFISNTSTSFTISRSIYDDHSTIPDTSYIAYSTDNTIDIDKSIFNLSNNILLHKTYSVEDSSIDSIILKNQLLQSDIFSSSNNLLSSNTNNLYVNNLREYSSIFQNIDEETSESLELNYVYYNKNYNILPGTNLFTSPSSMYPYSKLNVNDTKFVDSGAFSYVTPQFSDKIYHLSDDIINNENGQYLLCTWLSGSPTAIDKIWVDRYYYPDLIDKQTAISTVSELYSTYDNYIEQLIYNNVDILSSVQYKKIFDKKSDLIFEPNQNYQYVRISDTIFSELSSQISKIDPVINLNYFKSINESGELILAFSFDGDESSWSVKSERNNINSGLSIEKNGYEITITYDVYDSTMFNYDLTEFSWIRNSKTIKIEPLQSNFVSVGINTKTNQCYFFVNNTVEHQFNLPEYQLYVKHLLYGDFFVYYDSDKKIKLSEFAYPKIYNIIISNSYIPIELISFIFLMSNNKISDNIAITLPCGMRNSNDSIELLNSICGSSTFKSNFIDIDINNLNISDKNILDGLSQVIETNILEVLPANTNINSINYKNYKS